MFGMGAFFLIKYFEFNSSNYRIASGNGFLRTVFDKGNYGEFLIFIKLESLKGHKYIMSNLYIPKADGTTTEVDLLMLSETGIYVFESKNYSGWIFGNERNRYWTQSLPNRQKNRFFNPVWQNKGHISALSNFVRINQEHFYKSYIIFSERCTLKKIKINSPKVKVIKRDSLLKQIKNDIATSPKLLNLQQIDAIYRKLKACSQADDTIKRTHVEQVRIKQNR